VSHPGGVSSLGSHLDCGSEVCRPPSTHLGLTEEWVHMWETSTPALQTGCGHESTPGTNRRVGATPYTLLGYDCGKMGFIAVWVRAFLTFSNSLWSGTIGTRNPFNAMNLQWFVKTAVASKFGHTTYADIYMGEM